MGRRIDQLPLKTSLATTDLLIGHDGSAGFQVAVSDASTSLGGGGGLGGGVVTSILMECADDSSKHRVVLRLRDGIYGMSVRQDSETGTSVTSLTIQCQDDSSDHLVTLRLRDGIYLLRVNQDPA